MAGTSESIHRNSVWVIAQGYIRKIPRCNVMFFKKNYNELNEKEVTKDVEKISGVKFKDDKEHEKEDVQDNRRITR